jgi:hypothetical protein
MKTSAPSVTLPNPTPLLFLVAATLAWFLFWKEDPNSTLLLVMLAMGVVLLASASVYVLANRPEFAAPVLFAATAMPRWFVDVSGLKVRPEHMVCGVMLVALPFWLSRLKGTALWITADYLLVGYLAMHFLSSTFISIAPGQTIKWCLQQTVVVLPYLFLRVLISDASAFKRAFRILLAVGAVEAAFGILCFYSNLLFKTEIGMEIGQYGSIPGTYGTQYEANLLGSYCGATSAMFLTMYLQQRRRVFLYGFALTFAGMAISLSRGALLATMIALSVVCLRGIKLHLFNKAVLARGAFTMLCVGIIVAPAIYGLWSERLSTVDVSDISADDNTRVRVLTLGLATQGMIEHPVLGNGTASYQLQFSAADLGAGDDAGWIGNTEMRVLYDTGAIGLGLFTAFLAYLVVGVWKQMKREPVVELEALVVAALAYCISFQFTEGTLLAFSWVHLGMIAAGVAVFRRYRNIETQTVTRAIPGF